MLGGMWHNNSYSLALQGSTAASNELVELYLLLHQLIGNASVFYFNPGRLDCTWHTQQSHILATLPQWVWQSSASYGYRQLRSRHSSELFVLACLSGHNAMWQLSSLTASLQQLLEVPVLIELADSPADDQLAIHILQACQQHGLLNAALYFPRWTHALLVYSYVAFARFQLIKQRVTRQLLQLYSCKLRNMQGYPLRVLPDQSEPNTLLYYDARGVRQATGYLWHFIAAFARKHQAKLQLVQEPLLDGHIISHMSMLEFVRNDSADFGLTTQILKDRFQHNYYHYSYPVSFGSWCLMMPLERQLPISELYARLLSQSSLALLLLLLVAYFVAPLLLFLLDVRRLPRLRQLLATPICALSLLLLCACAAQLQSWLIQPPHQPAIHSFDELKHSDLKIFGMRNEFDYHDGEFRAKYANAFQLTTNSQELFALRQSFNTSYAYTITTMKWRVLATLQQHFAHPLFRYAEDVCFNGFTPFSILLAEQSIYRDALTHYTLQAQQAGLLQHWMRHSFYDMVRAGRMEIKDYSSVRLLHSLQLQDLSYALYWFAGGLLLALLTFLLELLANYLIEFLVYV